MKVNYTEMVDFIKKEFDIEPIEKAEYFIYPTICHNLDVKDASHKLYLYKNEETDTPLFFCYTECGEAFNIYRLIQKYKALRGEEISFKDAFKLFHGQEYQRNFKPKEEEEYSQKVFKFENPLQLELPQYPEQVLEIFGENSHTHPWALEGIDKNVLDKFEIFYSVSYEGVVIPHRDWRGNLIGLRIRTYNKEKAKRYKYMPMLLNNIYYRHPVSLNLFGLFQNQGAIRRAKRVILAESEKAVLQADSMFEEDNITLAVCGSTISNWQIMMLIYYLNVEEVTIAFDKEYSNYSEAFEYVQKIKEQVKSLSNFTTVSVLIDDKEQFSLKESPFDRTINEFYSMKRWQL